ncbi:MAG: NfeD family protein [Saprospiraceae bacterium]|nr:NfeD family protein [Saprospiraceae bacterium]
MELATWQIWTIAAIVLFIAEVFTPSFLSACLGIGCLMAAAAAGLGTEMTSQLTAFSLGTLAAFFGVRPFMLRYGHRKGEGVATNVEALIGRQARVVVTIDNQKGEGRVAVDGDDWRASTTTGEVVADGRWVRILRVESTMLVVEPIN